jgi:hypothetical protein
MCTKFHDDQFRHSSAIEVVTPNNLKGCSAGVTDGGIYELCCGYGFRW